ncbi:MAG: hypothetical protein BGO98_05495 [Myxococcales bacterium 68-20]|nr:MAG: hypothetical protein BGO98_05495 [Myxococcales bacterium 68-20]
MESALRHPIILLTLPVFAAAIVAVACSGSSSSDSEDVTGEEDAGSSVIPPGSEPSSSSPPPGPAGSGLATGLPCDVQGILENRCIACHSTDNPPPLLDYDDLKAPSKKDPNKTMAQAALAEMMAKTMPPTPAVPPEDDEIATFAEWLDAGAPRNPSACTDPPPDGGAPGDGGATDGGAPITVKCTSGKTWDLGNAGSPLMNPGQACNACHQQQGGPNLRIAGTVYPSLHEPNNCVGSAPPPQLTVVITDSRNRTFNLPVNAAGNFSTRNGEQPRPPFKAVVRNGQQTRAMVGSVTSGDCNSCHTVNGANGAPGRIMAP